MVARAMTVLPPSSPLDVYYPESDGRPMAETDVHARLRAGESR